MLLFDWIFIRIVLYSDKEKEGIKKYKNYVGDMSGKNADCKHSDFVFLKIEYKNRITRR